MLLASLACTVKLDVPSALGVPLHVPSVFNAKPVGTVPEITAKVYGVTVPPYAPRFCVYGMLTTPSGKVFGVTVMTGACPESFNPQQASVPSLLTAQV